MVRWVRTTERRDDQGPSELSVVTGPTTVSCQQWWLKVSPVGLLLVDSGPISSSRVDKFLFMTSSQTQRICQKKEVSSEGPMLQKPGWESLSKSDSKREHGPFEVRGVQRKRYKGPLILRPRLFSSKCSLSSLRTSTNIRQQESSRLTNLLYGVYQNFPPRLRP